MTGMTQTRPPLSEAEARRIRYSPSTHRTCPGCGYVVRDIKRHHTRQHSGEYRGPLQDAEDASAQQHLRSRRTSAFERSRQRRRDGLG